MHRPEHGNQEEEVVELKRPMVPAPQHGIRDEEKVHEGHQLENMEGDGDIRKMRKIKKMWQNAYLWLARLVGTSEA